MKKHALFMLTALAVLALGCNKTPNTDAAPAAKSESDKSAMSCVQSKQWKLIQLNGETVSEFQPTLGFDLAEQRVFGSTGCNRYFGGFSQDETTISFQEMGTTMMACTEPAMQMEAKFNALLNKQSFRYDVAEQTLNLYQDDTLVMVFGVDDSPADNANDNAEAETGDAEDNAAE
ncbi:MAG: META domain-containing protein [Myxococcales bacterium]|jgi:heat shock protein HslJ|nr:META domain-containing protein [Myxococcales bacterium]